jgi:hypothetical protein
MGTFKRTAVVLMSGLLLSGASAPAWSQDSQKAAPATTTAATSNAANQSLLGMLAPALTEPARHDPEKQCDGATQLYSQHDVVGDPDACFMGRINDRSGNPNSMPGVL